MQVTRSLLAIFKCCGTPESEPSALVGIVNKNISEYIEYIKAK